MGQKQENLIVVLDIGSAWTRVLAADVNENVLRYRGHGVTRVSGNAQGVDCGAGARGEGGARGQ